MESTHISSRYDEQLGRIKTGILDMGNLVIAQLRKATDALTEFDADTVDDLIAADRMINGLHKSSYSRAERLIALRQPMALDLRQALLPISIAGQLERIGDHAKSVAKRARVLADTELDDQIVSMIQKMSALTCTALKDVLRAYDASDIELAAQIRARDLDIDALNKDVFAKAVAATKDKPEMAETYIHLILLARGFERVGDQSVNIARHVHQIVTGEDLKASE